MTKSKMVKGLPFEATLPKKSLDEINDEISAVRAERKR